MCKGAKILGSLAVSWTERSAEGLTLSSTAAAEVRKFHCQDHVVLCKYLLCLISFSCSRNVPSGSQKQYCCPS